VAHSRVGERVASGAEDGRIALFDAGGKAMGEPFQAHSDAVSAVVFSPDGLLVSGGRDGVIRFWDVAARKAVASINLGAAVDRVGYAGNKLWAQASTDYIYFFRPDRTLAVTVVAYGGGVLAYTPNGEFSGEPNGSNRPLAFAAGGTKLTAEQMYDHFSPSAVAAAIAK
jgi:WD40 repeat protein